MHAPDDVTTSDLDALLDALDKADAAVREIYRKLADDPDLASEHETALSDLHAKRRELAQRVGLAALAQRRASVALKASEPTAEAAPEPVTPIVVDTFPEAVLTNGNGDPPAPASDADLARFRETVRTRGLGNGLHNGTADTTPWAFVLHELLKSVGPPRDLGSTVAMIEEADALDEIGDEERQASWARLPRHAQQAWIGMLVARTRALKEHPSVSADVKTTAKRIINRYPAFASKHAPGHVNGLKVTHTPV